MQPYLGTFRPKFGKTFVTFEISAFKFVKIRSSMLNKKTKFGTKTALFGYFWTGI